MKGKAVEKEWVKIASRPLFNLYQSTMESNLWQIRLNGSGGYLRRRFHAPSLQHALEAAPVVAGLEKSPEERNRISLADAFSMALQNTNRRERSRLDWAKAVDKFMTWLRKHHPLCTHWGMMTRQILREYLNGCYAGKSANYRRLQMQPLLQTAAFMHREYEFSAIGERLGIGSKLKTLPRTVYLEDVISFCDFLRDRKSHLEVGACLQGLAGLQLLEALRLTWKNVDLECGLIEITGEVKNQYRNRVIPVCGRVLDALKRANERRTSGVGKVRPVVDCVVVGARGHVLRGSALLQSANARGVACVERSMRLGAEGPEKLPPDLRQNGRCPRDPLGAVHRARTIDNHRAPLCAALGLQNSWREDRSRETDGDLPPPRYRARGCVPSIGDALRVLASRR
jgi:integrase